MAKTKAEETQKEKLVEVYIPKQDRNDNQRFIAVNGERILVQTGKPVLIPERFAEVIENSNAMAEVSDRFIADNIKQ